MFTIYSDKSIFENIVSTDNYPNWERIIKNHSTVCLDISDTDLQAEMNDPNSILFHLLNANAVQVKVVALDAYFREVYANRQTVIKTPRSAYFLNLPVADAATLQEDTGVIINCNGKIDDDILSKGVNLDWLAGEVIQNNWSEILNSFINYPSNSLIINDRNLFANEENSLNIGVDNVLRILDNLLPHNLKADYHVLIQSEQKADLRNKTKCDNLASTLSLGISRLRPYNFQIEIIFSFSGTNFYQNTHNRRIYSNYKYGKCEHSLASFKIRNANNTRNDDSFSLICSFNKVSSISDTIVNLTAQQNGLKRYKELAVDCIDKLNKNGPNDRYYRYYLNGVEVAKGQSIIIHNRLLN